MTGKLDAQQAYFGGKLKISGNIAKVRGGGGRWGRWWNVTYIFARQTLTKDLREMEIHGMH